MQSLSSWSFLKAVPSASVLELQEAAVKIHQPEGALESVPDCPGLHQQLHQTPAMWECTQQGSELNSKGHNFKNYALQHLLDTQTVIFISLKAENNIAAFKEDSSHTKCYFSK